MPTLRSDTFSNFFNRLLQFGHSGNTGTPTSTTNIQAGNGVATSTSLSDDVLSVQPINDDTTGTMLVKNQGGDNILAVDASNKRVLCGSSQINALTQYKVFNSFNLLPTGAGSHMIMSSGIAPFASTGLTEASLGSGTDPATTLDVSAEATESVGLVPCYWYLPDAITIMTAHVLMGTNNASDDTFNFHLMSYDMSTSAGTYGDLSGGVVIADSGETEEVDEDVIKIDTMTNLPTDVAAGKIILATLESDATNQSSIQMIVKYHIQ